jgi:hypothetical protein
MHASNPIAARQWCGAMEGFAFLAHCPFGFT